MCCTYVLHLQLYIVHTYCIYNYISIAIQCTAFSPYLAKNRLEHFNRYIWNHNPNQRANLKVNKTSTLKDSSTSSLVVTATALNTGARTVSTVWCRCCVQRLVLFICVDKPLDNTPQWSFESGCLDSCWCETRPSLIEQCLRQRLLSVVSS